MRILRLTGRFHASQRAHAPAGSPELRAVTRILAELGAAAALPGRADITVTIPPNFRCLGRPIPSAGLIVCYRLTPDAIEILAVKRSDS